MPLKINEHTQPTKQKRDTNEDILMVGGYNVVIFMYLQNLQKFSSPKNSLNAYSLMSF